MVYFGFRVSKALQNGADKVGTTLKNSLETGYGIKFEMFFSIVGNYCVATCLRHMTPKNKVSFLFSY